MELVVEFDAGESTRGLGSLAVSRLSSCSEEWICHREGKLVSSSEVGVYVGRDSLRLICKDRLESDGASTGAISCSNSEDDIGAH